MKLLHLLDMSNLLFLGTPSRCTRKIVKPDKTEEVVYLGSTLNVLSSILYMNGDIAVAADTKPTLRLAIDPNYKGTRGGSSSTGYDKRTILINRFLCKSLLSICGVNVLSEEGYEADDIIATVSRDCSYMYDRIRIVSSDVDLIQCISSNTYVDPPTKAKQDITYTHKNAHLYIDKNNNLYNYQCINLWKILTGDKSDNILRVTSSDRALAIIYRVLENTQPDELLNKKAIKKILQDTFYEEPDRLTLALKNTELVFSMEVPNLDYNFSAINKSKLSEVIDALKLNRGPFTELLNITLSMIVSRV